MPVAQCFYYVAPWNNLQVACLQWFIRLGHYTAKCKLSNSQPVQDRQDQAFQSVLPPSAPATIPPLQMPIARVRSTLTTIPGVITPLWQLWLLTLKTTQPTIICADLPGKIYSIPSQFGDITCRPDIFAWSRKHKQIVMFELTIPFEENIADVDAAKRKQDHLIALCWWTKLYAVQVGS